jgi:flagellar basal-body rod protein FlgF
MENSLLVSLSRQVALQRELEVIANNVANSNTNGFKSRSLRFSEYLMPQASADAFPATDRPVSFTVDAGSGLDFSNGPLEQTGRTLDIAVSGNAVIAVQTASGERYTRNGSLQLDSRGILATSDGYPVVGSSGPITFSPQETDIQIGKDGTITTNQGEKGKIRLMTFTSADQLENVGANVYSAKSALRPATGEVKVEAGYIERSNVRPVYEMSRLIEVNRTYATVASIIQQTDALRRTAIDRLSDVGQTGA